jgi:hypothetical protein
MSEVAVIMSEVALIMSEVALIRKNLIQKRSEQARGFREDIVAAVRVR